MSATPPTHSVSAHDVHFSYGKSPVLVSLRWAVTPGVTVLTGLSGAGKSTVLALLAGVRRPSQGRILVQGGDPGQEATRRHLGYMPQEGGSYMDLTVEDNLAIFAAPHGAGAQEVERVLELLALRKRRKEPLKALSAGWRQRVSLGAALVGDPFVLLLDEPLSQADPEFSARAWAHFHDLANRGRTVVVATSQIAQALQADRVAVLRGGRLAFEGDIAALAPAGKAKVVMSYRARTGPFNEEVTCQDYRAELLPLLSGLQQKPAAIEIQPETPEQRLEALLTKDMPHGDVQL